MKPTAIYENDRGVQIGLFESITGSLFQQVLNGNGIQHYFDFSDVAFHVLKKEPVKWLKTPDTDYDVWHIAHVGKMSCGGIYPPVKCYSIYSHSQGTWDETLRHVDNSDIATFPTAK